MITLHPFGDYTNRQPLAYAQIRAACRGAVEVSDQFETADIIAVSHTKDLEAYGAHLRQRLGAGQRLVLLSEEPFWDTIWGADPLTRLQTHQTKAGPLAFSALNHHTSTLYDFAEIPYFLLTDPHFSTRYGRWFRRNARLSPQQWHRHFAKPQYTAVFMAARRDIPRYAVSFPKAGVFALSNQRTRIAAACVAPDIPCLGLGWQDGPRRQALADWHLDKFLRLDARCRFLSGIENTHQKNYISEKLFDAYAIGAIPLYIADPDHRVHDIAPSGSWLNLYETDPQHAAALIRNFTADRAFAECYSSAQSDLAALFGAPAPLARELSRLRQALVRELTTVLESDQANIAIS